VNPKRSDAILDTTTGVRATTAFDATILPPPPLQPEDIPIPPLSPQASPPPETNEILTNLVNLLHQQSDRLERV